MKKCEIIEQLHEHWSVLDDSYPCLAQTEKRCKSLASFFWKQNMLRYFESYLISAYAYMHNLEKCYFLTWDDFKKKVRYDETIEQNNNMHALHLDL